MLLHSTILADTVPNTGSATEEITETDFSIRQALDQSSGLFLPVWKDSTIVVSDENLFHEKVELISQVELLARLATLPAVESSVGPAAVKQSIWVLHGSSIAISRVAQNGSKIELITREEYDRRRGLPETFFVRSGTIIVIAPGDKDFDDSSELISHGEFLRRQHQELIQASSGAAASPGTDDRLGQKHRSRGAGTGKAKKRSGDSSTSYMQHALSHLARTSPHKLSGKELCDAAFQVFKDQPLVEKTKELPLSDIQRLFAAAPTEIERQPSFLNSADGMSSEGVASAPTSGTGGSYSSSVDEVDTDDEALSWAYSF